MKKWKVCLIVLSVLVIGIALSGCKKKQSSDEEQRYAWPLGTSSPEDTVTQIYAEKFADEVSRLSDGKMKIEVYPNSTLGGDRELLGYADQGFRVMSTNKEIRDISDFKGQKIRTMENSYHLDFWKDLGANPTPMTFSEVYIGLQQGTIDAQENPYEVIVSSKLYEQQDYVVETNHLPHYISLIVSDEFYKDLPEDQQKIITEAAETAKEYARQASDDRIDDRIKTIEDSGTKIIRLSDETKEQIRDAASDIYDEIEDEVSKELVDAYLQR